MFDIISFLGTIASIGSVPLALYIYLKSSEQKVMKIRKDIVKTLSYQLGKNRNLTSLEIQSVINSKTRENKIKSINITSKEVIEDLISETLSNPLIDIEKKEFFLNNFKKLLKFDELSELLENFILKNENLNIEHYEKLNPKILELMRNNAKRDMMKIKRNNNFSRIFGLFVILSSLGIFILALLDENFNFGVRKLIGETYSENITLAVSVFIATVSLIFTIISRYLKF